MTRQPALYALERLHAELGGQILQNKADARRLTLAMMQVEAVMKMLEPGYSIRAIAVRRRKPNPWFKRGTVFRHALDVLRAAGRPLTGREIAEGMLAAEGITDVRRKAVRDLAGSVQSSLRNHRGGNITEDATAHPARWSVV